MSNTQLQSTEDQVKWTVRHSQVMKVLAAMADGMSQADACALVGIAQRTYQRWISKPEMQQVLRQFAIDALNAGQVVALHAFPSIVQYQSKIAAGTAPNSQPRDSTKAAEFISKLLQQALQAGNGPKQPGEQASDGIDNDVTKLTAEFRPRFQGQRVTVTVETDSAQVIDGQATVVAEADGGS
jgi:hypothetical protein